MPSCKHTYSCWIVSIYIYINIYVLIYIYILYWYPPLQQSTKLPIGGFPRNQTFWETSIWSIEHSNTCLQNLVRVQDEHRAHAGFELHLSATRFVLHNLISFSSNYCTNVICLLFAHLGMKLGGPWTPKMWQVVYSTMLQWRGEIFEPFPRSDPPGGRERPPSSVAETKERLRPGLMGQAGPILGPYWWGPNAEIHMILLNP